MSRGKQPIRKGAWYIVGKRRKKEKKKGKGFPIGLLASVGVPILSELAKPVFKKILGRGTHSKRLRR